MEYVLSAEPAVRGALFRVWAGAGPGGLLLGRSADRRPHRLGLSHFVVDEAFDRRVIEMMRRSDGEALGALPESLFQSGTSEIKNWIVIAGAMSEAGFTMTLVGYVPCYRSEAGTGNAMDSPAGSDGPARTMGWLVSSVRGTITISDGGCRAEPEADRAPLRIPLLAARRPSGGQPPSALRVRAERPGFGVAPPRNE